MAARNIVSFTVLSIITVPFLATANFNQGGPDSCPPGYTFVPPSSCELIPSTPEPVIIIPGLLASLNLQVTLLDKEDGGSWGFVPPAKPLYRGLIERLENAGLDVHVAHYDWRKTTSTTSANYLKKTIDDVISQTRATKVDLVAHSLGGLVARDYIQGPQFQNDVDQLITIGTPHQGSADAYLAYEGGIIPERWSVGSRAYITLVEQSLNAGSVAPLLRPTSFRTYFPSLHNLLPTDSYINQSGVSLPPSAMQESRNLYLENLNNSLDQDLIDTGVALSTIAGNDIGTLQYIPTGNLADRSILDQLRSRWRQGHPIPDPPSTDTTDGDQTVLLSSAKISSSSYTLANTAHEDLPEEAQEEVLALLGSSVTGSHLAYARPDSLVGVTVLSPVIPTITGPNGETLSDTDNTFSDAAFTWDSNDPNGPKLLTISNPPPGTYTVTLTGTDQGDFTAITTFADSDETTGEEFTDHITTNQVIVYTFTITDGEDTSLTISLPDSPAPSSPTSTTQSNGPSDEQDCCPGPDPEFHSKQARVLGIKTITSPYRFLVPLINHLHRLSYGRNPSYWEHIYWWDRVLKGHFSTTPQLLGAMQWQHLHGNPILSIYSQD